MIEAAASFGAAVAADLERTLDAVAKAAAKLDAMPNWRGSTPCTSSRRGGPSGARMAGL